MIPAALAVLLALVEMLPLPLAARLALPSQAFIAWRGLFTEEPKTRALVVGVAVALAWAVVATTAAYQLFVRRDFTDLTNDGSGQRVLFAGVLPLAALTALSVLVIAVATPGGGLGIDKTKLEHSLATTY